jgi:hypothetical protein
MASLTDAFPSDFTNFTNSLDHFATSIVRFGINYKFGAVFDSEKSWPAERGMGARPVVI